MQYTRSVSAADARKATQAYTSQFLDQADFPLPPTSPPRAIGSAPRAVGAAPAPAARPRAAQPDATKPIAVSTTGESESDSPWPSLAFGLSTGAAIRDGSLDAKALGCGLVLGRKLGLTLFDNEVM